MDPNNKRNISGATFAVEPQPEFSPQSIISRLGFALDDLQPPRSCYVRPDDTLIFQVSAIQAAGNATVSYRILDPDGQVIVGQFTLVVVNQATSTLSVPLIEGLLLSVNITAAAGGTVGQPAYGLIALQRGSRSNSNLVQVLASGAVGFTFPLTWPDARRTSPSEIPGGPNVAAIGNPAAGADFTFTTPNISRNRFLCVTATLTTAVAVANRAVQFLIQTGGGVTVFASTPGPNQAASLVWQYTFANFGYAPINVGTTVSIHVPDSILLAAGMIIKTLTANIQAADQWSAIESELQQSVDIT